MPRSSEAYALNSHWGEHKLVCGYKFQTYLHEGTLMENITLPKTLSKKTKLEHVNRAAFVPQNA